MEIAFWWGGSGRLEKSPKNPFLKKKMKPIIVHMIIISGNSEALQEKKNKNVRQR